jgi:hypothetical protein
MTDRARQLFPWALIASIVTPAVLVVAVAMNLEDSPYGLLYDLFALPPLLLVWAASVAALTNACRSYLRSPFKCHPRLAALAIPTASILASIYYLNPLGPWYAVRYAGQVIRFAALKPAYDREIAVLPRNPSRLKVFDWGGALLIAWDGVIYDESDQITLPKDRRSSQWAGRYDAELTELCDAQPLWDHYYVGLFGC